MIKWAMNRRNSTRTCRLSIRFRRFQQPGQTLLQVQHTHHLIVSSRPGITMKVVERGNCLFLLVQRGRSPTPMPILIPQVSELPNPVSKIGSDRNECHHTVFVRMILILLLVISTILRPVPKVMTPTRRRNTESLRTLTSLMKTNQWWMHHTWTRHAQGVQQVNELLEKEVAVEHAHNNYWRPGDDDDGCCRVVRNTRHHKFTQLQREPHRPPGVLRVNNTLW